MIESELEANKQLFSLGFMSHDMVYYMLKAIGMSPETLDIGNVICRQDFPKSSKIKLSSGRYVEIFSVTDIQKWLKNQPKE